MLRVTEAFGGIGAQRRALQALGIPFEVVEYIEIDKYAVTSYNAIYGENFEPMDITQLERLKPTDLLTYSFPCQDISVAGLNKGIVRGGTRSGLLYEIERLLLQAQKDGWLPKYLLLENVKNLVGKKYKPQFNEWILFLETLGYKTQWFVLNSKDFGMAQSRERVFAISILEVQSNLHKPIPLNKQIVLKDYLEENVDDIYFLSDDKKINISKWKSNQQPLQRVLGLNSVCPTIIARGAGCYHRGMILFSPYENGTKNMRSNFNVPIRVLTPLECWRLMGFTDKDFEKARQALNNTYYKGKDKSSSQLYKQAGNSIVTNCLIAIFYCMFFENSTNYERYLIKYDE